MGQFTLEQLFIPPFDTDALIFDEQGFRECAARCHAIIGQLENHPMLNAFITDHLKVFFLMVMTRLQIDGFPKGKVYDLSSVKAEEINGEKEEEGKVLN